MNYQTIKVQFQESICFLQIDRPQADNTINSQLVAEFNDILSVCEESATVIVLSGTPEVFCLGADFKALAGASKKAHEQDADPGPLYDLWLRLATGPYVTISHVRGKANAGGRGTVVGNSLEQSNVDIATEFSNLIVAQRSFQANSRVITTFNQALQDLLQII